MVRGGGIRTDLGRDRPARLTAHKQGPAVDTPTPRFHPQIKICLLTHQTEYFTIRRAGAHMRS